MVYGRRVLAPFQRRVSAGKKIACAWIIGRRILDKGSAIFYYTDGERKETRSLKLTTASVVIPHGFDTQEYLQLPSKGDFRAKYLRGHQGLMMFFVSRLKPRSGWKF